MARVLVGSQENSTRSLSASFLAVPGVYARHLFLRFRGVWVRICWWGSWIVALCIFVLDHDPSNSEFGL
jgi:hypothetical protein